MEKPINRNEWQEFTKIKVETASDNNTVMSHLVIYKNNSYICAFPDKTINVDAEYRPVAGDKEGRLLQATDNAALRVILASTEIYLQPC
jgi:hypothetical protein